MVNNIVIFLYPTVDQQDTLMNSASMQVINPDHKSSHTTIQQYLS